MSVIWWRKRERKIVDIPAAAMVLEYNPSMGGKDIIDHAFSCNRPIIWSKKWWFPLLSFCLQSSLYNSFLTYWEIPGAGTTYLDFLCPVAQTYFVSSGNSTKIPWGQMLYGNKRVEKRVSTTTKNDQISHFAYNAEKSEDVLFVIDQVSLLNVMFMFTCNASLLFTILNKMKLALLIKNVYTCIILVLH